ncbi:MAG: hypothetical protein AAGF71_13230 [Pseudomonadota bacterium]
MLSKLLLAAALSFTTTTASALTWTLQDVVFSSGAVATGSFDYDADLDVFDNVNITTTAGAFAATDFNLGLDGVGVGCSLQHLIPPPSANRCLR